MLKFFYGERSVLFLERCHHYGCLSTVFVLLFLCPAHRHAPYVCPVDQALVVR